MKLKFQIASIKPFGREYLVSVPESVPKPWILIDRKIINLFWPIADLVMESDLDMVNGSSEVIYTRYKLKKVG